MFFKIKRTKKAGTKSATTFYFYSPEAREVKLAGDFNGWQPQNLEPSMDRNGFWEVSLPLKIGEYQYKFIVDGDWQLDPSHINTVPNPFGTVNSIIQVGKTASA